MGWLSCSLDYFLMTGGDDVFGGSKKIGKLAKSWRAGCFTAFHITDADIHENICNWETTGAIEASARVDGARMGSCPGAVLVGSCLGMVLDADFEYKPPDLAG